jgi:hypothetical protein
MEGEWRLLLSRMRDAITLCPACGETENFFDESKLNEEQLCWDQKCKHRLDPYRLKLGKTTVMLHVGAKLHPHHLDDRNPEFDFATRNAEVVRHPADPNTLGLRNHTNETWVATMPDGKVSEVEPSRSIRLAPDVRINFGRVEGLVLR